MLLFNQSKNQLSWDMNGVVYGCEPWGTVDVPDEFVPAVRSRGLPLGPVQVAPEIRAQERIAEEQAAATQAPILALRKEADEAKARERAAVEELERTQAERDQARKALREAQAETDAVKARLQRSEADRIAAEKLLSDASAQATESEARAIKAEALLAERSKKPDKQKPAQA